MYRKMDELVAAAKALPTRQRLVVAAAQDPDVLGAVKDALEWGIVSAILVGSRPAMMKVAGEVGLDLTKCQVVDVEDPKEAARTAVAIVSRGEADLVMKGKVSTADILRAVLNREQGLRTGRLLCHVAVLEVPGFDRLFFLSDGAMNIAPTLEQKAQIIGNAVETARRLGVETPRVATLCAVEVVNPDMPPTVEAEELRKMAEAGQFGPCYVSGPIALDGAVNEHSAEVKGISGPVAGKADILMVPMIEAGNVLYKAMIYFAQAKAAGIIAGARAPVVLTSRSDSHETKLNSIALGAVLAAAGDK
jgi:phosphate butyryltransferase